MIVFLQQQGIQVGQIQYPSWYFESSVPQGNQQSNQFGQQKTGFGQAGQSSKYIPGGQQGYQSQYNNLNQSVLNSQLAQSIQDPQAGQRQGSASPQHVQSTYQIGIATQQQHPVNVAPFNQSGPSNFHDTAYYANQKPQSHPANYGYGDINEGHGNLKGHLEELRQENQNLRQHFQSMGTNDDYSQLQQRLNSAEQQARNY